jgi:hypothetical protein
MTESERKASLLWILAGLLCIYAIWGVGQSSFGGWLLDLGSIRFPAPIYSAFLVTFALVGGLAAYCLTRGYAGFLRLRVEALDESVRAVEERRLVVGASILAGLVAAAARHLILEETPLTEDESSYRFMAELLASGRVAAESHPMKLFFDRATMVNDGRLYSQYFLGWPALRVLGVITPIGGFTNAVLHALTVPALHYVARDLGGKRVAVIAVALFLVSPFLALAAATDLSHTSCVFALAWTHFFAMKARQEQKPALHAGVAFFFALAFTIRPVSALGIGLPLLVWWALSLRGAKGRDRVVAVASFVVPATAMAALFLAAIAAQTGSPFYPAYQRTLAYYGENGWRFALGPVGMGRGLANIGGVGLGEWLSHLGVGLLRTNFALFGWPLSLAFVFFAKGTKVRVVWAMAAGFLLAHLPVKDAGIDSFGPVHYAELCWPLILLTAVGAVSIAKRGVEVVGRARSGALTLGALAALSTCAVLVFVPVRVSNLALIADYAGGPERAIAELGTQRPLLVFAPRPFTRPCPTDHGSGPGSFRLFMPQNDPDLSGPIVWANHLDVETDRRLAAEYFPDREAFLLFFAGCEPALFPLGSEDAESIPPNLMRLHALPTGMVAEPYSQLFDPSGRLPEGWDPRSGPPPEEVSSP